MWFYETVLTANAVIRQCYWYDSTMSEAELRKEITLFTGTPEQCQVYYSAI